ncbi:MAG: FxLYD domain-containing protein [Bryobacteraceae bacterium]
MAKPPRPLDSAGPAGIKPQRPESDPPKSQTAWRRLLDRLMNGPAPTDPLYLTNRTNWQRMRVVAVVVTPIVLLVAVLALAWSGVFKAKDAPAPRELTVEEKAARILPNFDSKIQLPTNHDLDVQDVRVEHGPPRQVVGRVRNNTDRVISSADIDFDLTDDRWSHLGAVSTRVENLPPQSAVPFKFAVAQDTAEHVLVRDYQVH